MHTPDDFSPSDLFAAILSAFATLYTIIIIVLIAHLLSSCRASRTIHTAATHTDSTRVETRIVVQRHTDTIKVQLPPETASSHTTDTASTLHTTYALTTARWDGAHLHHTLTTRPAPIPVPVQRTETTRDSIIYRHIRDSVQVPVPAPHPLTPCQQNAIKYYPRLLLLTLLLTLWTIRRPMLKLFAHLKK